MPREISAGIIIYKKEKDRDGKIEPKYLMLYHGGGYWNFPKGKLEQDERSFNAALREVGEETGIPAGSLRMAPNFRVTDKYIYQREGQKIFKIVIFFLAQTSQSEIKVSFEHEGYAWFPYRDALKHTSHKNIKIILKRANDFLRRKNLPQNSQNTQK
ncbi:MAG: NUDIX domain-containing protein [bacterium]|nr:NUDIX domain-containing protein [bacterium]